MKSCKIKMGGKDYNLAVTWGAYKQIGQTVADPIILVQEIVKETTFSGQGIPYRPRHELSGTNAVAILGIALRENGYDFSDDEVGEAFLEDGPFAAIKYADEYISLMVSAGPEKGPKGEKKQ